MSIDDTLKDRGSRYGDIAIEAEISQGLQNVMAAAPNWWRLTNAQRHCLIMDTVKVARILNGDPGYADNWHDRVGYAKLAEAELERNTNGDAYRTVQDPTRPRKVSTP